MTVDLKDDLPGRLLSFGPPRLLHRHAAESFALRVQSQMAGIPTRLAISTPRLEWLTVTGININSEPLLAEHVPSEVFGALAFGIDLASGGNDRPRPAGTIYELCFQWTPERRPIYKPRHRKWRGCWWVTHTRPRQESVAAVLELRGDMRNYRRPLR